MKEEPDAGNSTFEAYLWDGSNQLPGYLVLGPEEITFKPRSFEDSHLVLVIPYSTIESAEEFLLYGIVRTGIRICCGTKQEDLFILEEAAAFKKALQKHLT